MLLNDKHEGFLFNAVVRLEQRIEPLSHFVTLPCTLELLQGEAFRRNYFEKVVADKSKAVNNGIGIEQE